MRTLGFKNPLLRLLVAFLGIIAATLLILAAVRLISGRTLGLKDTLKSLYWTGRAILQRQSVTRLNQGKFTNVVFLHHSVGRGLIEQGGIRQALQKAGFSFWDQDYSWRGLTGPDGKYTGYSYPIPQDNTNPDGLKNIFSQREYNIPINAFSALMQHEVIVLKSCYPVSQISTDDQLEQDKAYYREIRRVMVNHPEKLFILVTQPPLNPKETNPEEAKRARALADWLVSEDFKGGAANIYVFNLFDYLAESDLAAPDYSMLRSSYREGSDSHPNQSANQTIGLLFAEFIIKSVSEYRELYSIHATSNSH